MISIITAVYNQLDMNRLFWDYLTKYTELPFELIIIDNGSTDGSREFFQSLPQDIVKVIANDGNYSYPHCQNQGIEAAKYDNMVFLNNDLIVPKHWDKRLMKVLGKNDRDIVSFGSNDRLYSEAVTAKVSHRFKWIKYPVIFLFGQSTFSLKLMLRLCYGNWEKYTEKIFRRYGYSRTIGFSGSAVAMTRRGVELLNAWDPALQCADYNLFYSSCNRAETYKDMQPMSIVNGIFIQHYRRLTFYGEKWPPFKDAENIKDLSINWTDEQIDRWYNFMQTFAICEEEHQQFKMKP